MAIPKQVQDRGDQADKIQLDLNGTAQPATPEGIAQDVTPQVPVQPPTNQTQPPVSPQNDLEQKYRSLLGRLDTQADELKTARANNDLLYRQISDLNREKAELKRSLEEAQAQLQTKTPDETATEPGLMMIDVDQVSRYGKEFGDMARTLNQILQNQTTPAKEPSPAPVQPQPQVPAAQQDKTMFRSAVTMDVYNIHKLDYNDIDVAPEFTSWLREYNQSNGVQNMQGWAESITVRDKATCLNIINNFLGTPQGQAFKTRVSNKSRPTQAPNQQPNIPMGTDVDHVTASTQPIGKIYTGKEILDFFTEIAKPNGKFKNNPEEAARIEADIFKAQNEGRVRG